MDNEYAKPNRVPTLSSFPNQRTQVKVVAFRDSTLGSVHRSYPSVSVVVGGSDQRIFMLSHCIVTTDVNQSGFNLGTEWPLKPRVSPQLNRSRIKAAG